MNNTILFSRLQGIIAIRWADTRLARRLPGWQAIRALDDMCADAWRWQKTVDAANTPECTN